MERVLAATDSIPVVTAITSIWSAPPAEIAAAYHRVVDRFGDRFVLGLGTAHAGINAPQQAKPLQAMNEMLDGLDAAGVPVDGRLLAALGPRMTQLAGQRSLGAHPYLAPASIIPEARRHLGDHALLAQALLVVITDNDQDVLTVGRQAIAVYLTLDNYRRNFLRAGYTEADLDHGGSEHLVHALVADTANLRDAVDQHLQAGADHTTIGVRPTPAKTSKPSTAAPKPSSICSDQVLLGPAGRRRRVTGQEHALARIDHQPADQQQPARRRITPGR